MDNSDKLVVRDGGGLMAAIFCVKKTPRIVRGFSISFSGDFPKTK